MTRNEIRSALVRGGAGLMAMASLAACAQTDASEPATRTLLGDPVQLGNGTARSYVLVRDGVPYEVGVALAERALDGLPGPQGGGGVHVHGHTTFETVLPLPAGNPTPYRHVLVNWNPGGHEPPGIYDVAHLDFHFYELSDEQRLAIDPADPAYQAKAERQPDADLVPEGYVLPAPLAFPRMGVHWVDPASPELNGEPFTHTFIFGSWDGQLIFAEPMITLDFLRSRRAVQAAVPAPRRHAAPGYYPSGYSIRWDEEAREHRIALTGLAPRG